MILSIMAICAGASAGALGRWLFGLWLNPIFSAFPLGTLAVNWLGSFTMGILTAFFALAPDIAPQWKLLGITGFLGSFTTFSAFAGEMGALLASGRIALCAGAICLHVFGSILLFFLGAAGVGLLKNGHIF